jgi:hypothetical protein
MTKFATNQPYAEYRTDYTLLTRTAANWGIPRALALQVIRRDVQCIYCRHVFAEPYEDRATCPSWEHIVNDLLLVSLDNVALCCVRCNSSKQEKSLGAWLESPYCKNRGITEQSIALVAISALHKTEYEDPQQRTLPAQPG